MLPIVKSLLLICLISGAGATVAYTLGYNPTYTFSILTIAQLILGYAINTIVSSYTTIKNKALENERLKLYSMQSAELKCAFCGEVSVVPIRLDIDNEYVCPSCGKRNSVYLNLTVARSTTPMNVNPLTTSMINDDEMAVIESIQNNE